MPTLKPVLLTIHQMQPFRPRTFIQTHFSSLEVRYWILPTLIKTKNTEFQAASNFGTHFVNFITIFWKKYSWQLNHFQWGRSRNNSRTYICYLFLSALHIVRAGLLYYFFFVLNCSRLPRDCHMTESHVILPPPIKWPHTINKIYVKMRSTSRQNWESNGFSSRDTPSSNRPDLQLLPQPKG